MKLSKDYKTCIKIIENRHNLEDFVKDNTVLQVKSVVIGEVNGKRKYGFMVEYIFYDLD